MNQQNYKQSYLAVFIRSIVLCMASVARKVPTSAPVSFVAYLNKH
jgi:hypothetical protein